jgi:hypothetical protein
MYGKTDSETIGETFNETDSKRNEKMTSNLLYPGKTMDHNISSPIFFTSPKVKLHLCRCHHPQLRWGWQTSLLSDLLGNFVKGTPNDGWYGRFHFRCVDEFILVLARESKKNERWRKGYVFTEEYVVIW